ncbi:hypothetical protein CQA66_08245 [Helicobacter aurati]|uniref:Uncharacterized protein n=1 Tax=Helicobacter aurati TaxID=137778 RepID=A0A3D8IYP6_9HELI|nr:hypothetical protein [Helicobacter aurati]RDU70388.1 hypothetical protein CQA66_08245 [Helicobacter aurati]
MKLAKPNTYYALIENEKVKCVYPPGAVSQWDEKELNLIPCDEYNEVGDIVENGIIKGPDIDSIKKKKLNDLEMNYSLATENKLFSYQEIETFKEQERESNLFIKDPHANTPLLDILALERNQDKKELAEKILSKSEKTNKNILILKAKYLTLCSKIRNCETKEELELLDLTLGVNNVD